MTLNLCMLLWFAIEYFGLKMVLMGVIVRKQKNFDTLRPMDGILHIYITPSIIE